MRALVLAASFALAACTAAEVPETATDGIIGGTATTAFPAVGYLVGQTENGEASRAACTAVLVSPTRIATTAECTRAFTLQRVAFGDRERGVGAAIVHPRYLRNVGPPEHPYYVRDERFDIAILPLSEPIVDVAPVVISSHALEAHTGGSVVGAGEPEPGVTRSARVDILIERNTIDALPAPSSGGSSCDGDLGGPLVLDDGTVAGLLRGHDDEAVAAEQFDDASPCRPTAGMNFVNFRFEPVGAFVREQL